MAGPPERISIFTPVSSPFDTRGPVHDFLPASIGVAVADHVVHRAVLGLRVPVGLEHDRVGADALQASRPRCRRRRRGLLPPVVAAPPRSWRPRCRPAPRSCRCCSLLSLPQAATSSRLAIGTVSDGSSLRCGGTPPCGEWWVEGVGVRATRRCVVVPLADRPVAEPAEEHEHDQAEQRRQDDGGEHLLGLVQALRGRRRSSARCRGRPGGRRSRRRPRR